MPTFIALLRGINVGGHNKVAMSDLRALLEAAGLSECRTLLQSGNAVFQSKTTAEAKLEKALETRVKRELGLTVDFFVRSAADWRAIVANNPFSGEAQRDPSRLAMMAAKTTLDAARVEQLRAAIRGPEIIEASGRQLYAYYPDGMGRSKLTINLIESKLATRVTARNWNTVLKLRDLVEE